MLLRMVVAGGGWWRTTRSGSRVRSSSKDGGRYFYIGSMVVPQMVQGHFSLLVQVLVATFGIV